MAKGRAVLSLDDMLQADRKKKKAESLAQEIFGKNRRQSTPLSGRTTPTPGGSLASRIGIHKTQRSASSSSIPKQRPTPRGPAHTQLSRSVTAHRLETAIQDDSGAAQYIISRKQDDRQTQERETTNGEISIRGAAGPYTVIAQNFAPGTTAADIESVVQPIGGAMAGCRLAASSPTVIAELVFLDKSGAEAVIATFNNKKADGRVLYVYMKGNGGSSTPVAAAPAAAPVEEPVADLEMEVEVDVQAQDSNLAQDAPSAQEAARPQRNERFYARGGDQRNQYENNRAYQRNDFPRALYQDGRYGFGASNGGQWDQRRDDRSNGWASGGGGGGGGGGGRMYSDRGGRRGGYQGGRW